jgi:peptidoglycan/LPS O-acetylase OafA/YrhL
MELTVELPKLNADRRYDIDALRAFAMLLGIGLHVALSFSGKPWLVVDSQQNEAFYWFFAGIHGFRMQLFFLVSGYFTALLLARYGWMGMLKNRAMRITIPCLIGLATIIQLNRAVTDWAVQWNVNHPSTPLIASVLSADENRMAALLDAGADIQEPDTRLKLPPLGWAVMSGAEPVTRLLLDRGAQVNATTGDGNTALHTAAFLGRLDLVKLLTNRGGDCGRSDKRGITPLLATFADRDLTTLILRLGIGKPLTDWDKLQEGRNEVRAFLGARIASDAFKSMFKPKEADAAKPKVEAPTLPPTPNWMKSYYRWISSEQFTVVWGDWKIRMFDDATFGHLWFLWFLSWLVPAYAILAGTMGLLRRVVPVPGFPMLVALPIAVVLTVIPTWFMGYNPFGGTNDGIFGPDTSMGILPKPHMLAYYGIFFMFGAYYFGMNDRNAVLGRGWWLMLPVALGILLPVGLNTLNQPTINIPAQTLYTWLMIIGLIGLFHAFMNFENKSIRYFSDASYWLYIAHLPLVIAAQALVCDWQMPALMKFLLIVVVITGLLLISYQLLVRHTWLGLLLNGPRKQLVVSGPAPAAGQ